MRVNFQFERKMQLCGSKHNLVNKLFGDTCHVMYFIHIIHINKIHQPFYIIGFECVETDHLIHRTK